MSAIFGDIIIVVCCTTLAFCFLSLSLFSFLYPSTKQNDWKRENFCNRKTFFYDAIFVDDHFKTGLVLYSANKFYLLLLFYHFLKLSHVLLYRSALILTLEYHFVGDLNLIFSISPRGGSLCGSWCRRNLNFNGTPSSAGRTFQRRHPTEICELLFDWPSNSSRNLQFIVQLSIETESCFVVFCCHFTLDDPASLNLKIHFKLRSLLILILVDFWTRGILLVMPRFETSAEDRFIILFLSELPK